jgi:ankyrin repeat protein
VAGRVLWDAVRTGDLVDTARVLDGSVEPDAFVAAHDSTGVTVLRTTLVEVAVAVQMDMVRLLPDHGTDPSLASHDGFTALMAAATSGHAALVQVLAARGTTLDATDAVFITRRSVVWR